jgi:hypothetical protein
MAGEAGFACAGRESIGFVGSGQVMPSRQASPSRSNAGGLLALPTGAEGLAGTAIDSRARRLRERARAWPDT